MFFYLYNGFGIYIKFETKRGSLAFLTGSYENALSFCRMSTYLVLFTPVRHFVETFL